MDSIIKEKGPTGFSILANLNKNGNQGANMNGFLFSPTRVPKSEVSTNSENINPNPNDSSTRKNKLQVQEYSPVQSDDTPKSTEPKNSTGWGNIKAKRLKKLAEQLPDIGGVEDLLKLQEELTESKEKTKVLEEKSNGFESRIVELEKEVSELSESNNGMKEQLSQQTVAKDSLIKELVEKTKQNVALEMEKNIYQKQLTEQIEKLREYEEENLRYKMLYGEQTNKLQSLGNELADVKEDSVVFQHSLNKMESHVVQLKQKFFFSCTIALKLSAQLSGRINNIDANTLYEQVLKEQVPFEEWHRWILNKLSV